MEVSTLNEPFSKWQRAVRSVLLKMGLWHVLIAAASILPNVFSYDEWLLFCMDTRRGECNIFSNALHDMSIAGDVCWDVCQTCRQLEFEMCALRSQSLRYLWKWSCRCLCPVEYERAAFIDKDDDHRHFGCTVPLTCLTIKPENTTETPYRHVLFSDIVCECPHCNDRVSYWLRQWFIISLSFL